MNKIHKQQVFSFFTKDEELVNAKEEENKMNEATKIYLEGVDMGVMMERKKQETNKRQESSCDVNYDAGLPSHIKQQEQIQREIQQTDCLAEIFDILRNDDTIDTKVVEPKPEEEFPVSTNRDCIFEITFESEEIPTVYAVCSDEEQLIEDVVLEHIARVKKDMFNYTVNKLADITGKDIAIFERIE